MSTAEKIIHEIEGLRPEKQSEVLEFVEFLKEKEVLRDFQWVACLFFKISIFPATKYSIEPVPRCV